MSIIYRVFDKFTRILIGPISFVDGVMRGKDIFVFKWAEADRLIYIHRFNKKDIGRSFHGPQVIDFIKANLDGSVTLHREMWLYNFRANEGYHRNNIICHSDYSLDMVVDHQQQIILRNTMPETQNVLNAKQEKYMFRMQSLNQFRKNLIFEQDEQRISERV